MKKRLVVTLALLLVGSPMAAQTGEGDSRWSFDLQAGAAVPTAEIEGEGLGAGLGFAGNFAYRFAPHVSLYAGWDWHWFTPDEVLGVPDLDLEETGYVFGLRFEHPFGGEDDDGPSYRIRAGMTVNHIEIEDSDNEIVDDSDHGIGFEVGAGVLFPLAGQWRFGPEARFRSLSRELDVGGGPVDVDLRYFVFGVVFSLGF